MVSVDGIIVRGVFFNALRKDVEERISQCGIRAGKRIKILNISERLSSLNF